MSHGHDIEPGHAPTARGYVTGYFIALVLTLIPFGTVAFADVSYVTGLLVIAVAAIAQLAVHLRWFLHLDMSVEQRWNSLSILFSIAVMALMVGGTIWLFYSLYVRHMMIGY